MAKTALPAPSAGSPGNSHHQRPGSKQKYSQQQSSSSASSSSTSQDSKLPLPQCKVKRNYACTKCPYYTQNPRSFLHHQKNVHSERLKVYECSHCLYASKHSQKLQRHIHMVHGADSKGSKKNHGFDKDGKPLLVPPVRIRVQRFEKFTDQHLAKLVIVEDVDVDDPEIVHAIVEEEPVPEEGTIGAENEDETEGEVEEEEEEEGEEEEDELDEVDARGEEEQEDEEEEDDQDDNDEVDAEDSVPVVSALQTAPPTSETPELKVPYQKLQQKKYKLDKPSVTFIRCSVCPFGSHSRTLVNRHEKSAHLKKKFFRCMKCNYVTHMRARYTKHVKYHTMPMIKCDDCDFRTPYKWNLDRHNRNHSITAPGTYKCSHCSFSADIKQSLTVHETNHHVPPVGGVFPTNIANRRRYRVGASDAPGSSVDGTEIVTYETTKEGGIVEIMTETKSAATSVSTSSGGGSTSKASASKIGGTSSTCTVVKKTMTTTTTTNSLPTMPIKIISVTSSSEDSTKPTQEKQPPRRRPMPQLIPIVEQQQQRRGPLIVRMRLPATKSPLPPDKATVITPDNYYSLAAGQSALSDFASIIDDTDCAPGPFNCSSVFTNATTSSVVTDNRRRSSSSTGSSSTTTTTSPKSKTASFFDKLKAKVDETADLTCSVCRYESKCLSEFMRHQRTHGGDDNDDATAHASTVDVNGLKTDDHTVTALERTTSTPPTPPPPVTAAELKSTRCQRCRKRCKTSTELIVHLATCRGMTAATTTAAAVIDSPSQPASAIETVTDEDREMQQHPMEHKIFVWNTAAVTTQPGEDHAAEDDNDDDDDREEQDSVTVTEIVMPPHVKPPLVEDESEDDINDTSENINPSNAVELKHQEQLKHAVRKEGKMYKTVFKCPHCTFWAATASRFHVHIVGHLNRKPFECSCCAYRSNWRWDITKHIRLKSARRGGGEESVAVANSHQGAKVLMTDETGRRNYSKYNRYLTVMEMDISDGADKAAGGECEDGKGVRKSVGGGITRKRRAPAFAHINSTNNGLSLKQHQTSSSGRATTVAGQLKRFKAAAIRNQQQTQNNASVTTLHPPSATGGDGRSKTVWKCKKCFFRDCDRLTVLNHVKAHYRRGEFGNNTGATKINSSHHSDAADTTDTGNTATNNELYVQTKKSAEINEIAEQNSPNTNRKKTKIPTTGTISDTLLLLSTNPKSLMLYDDENFLSCPLCDVTAASPGQLKEHMQSTHIPEETKYRCEYCPFWSEEKKAMLDHMMFAHEMDDGSVNTDVNATDINYGIEPRDESTSNSINDDEEQEMQGIDENGSSDDATANMTMFDNGSDDTNTMANMEVLFETGDENIVVVETLECKPDVVENDRGSTIETPSTPSKNSEKSSFSSTATDDKIADIMLSCEYDVGEERDEDEQVEDEEIIVRAEEVNEPTSTKIVKATLTPTASTISKEDVTTVLRTEIEVFECNECWYYSTNRRDLLAHKQLHVERGALYNCTECVFNVTKAAILYHHYRYGHVIEEPELRYPEDSVVRAGQRDMIAKNVDEKLENKTINMTDVDEATGPPMVWNYSKDNVPAFTKVFKCRFCPHTNRRRHNTVEHERMHSDHPEHQHHRQMQQRLSGCSVPPSPLHPCKRCTYVCNNAGVLASHVKVHSTSYSCSTVGFYDVTIVDSAQIRSLEYVLELEQSLLLDKSTTTNSGISHSGNEVLSDSSSDNESQDDVTKFTEIDDPELKFCPYCPARYFFRADLRFHMRFHRFRGWKNACDCCSFVARAKSHVATHEIVHCDEYAQRTTELLASGYPINPKYPQPSEYPASISDDSPPRLQRRSWSPPQLQNYDDSKPHSPEPESQRQRRTKRVRYSEPNAATTAQPPRTMYGDDTSKRRRRSMTVGVAMKTASPKPPPPALLPVSKTTNSNLLPPPLLPAPKIPVSIALETTSDASEKLVGHKSTSGATLKPVKTTKASYTRQYMCTMCPGKFFKSTALQYHKTLHGGPGRHRCRRCDYAVSTYGNLVRHETVHRDLPAREKVKAKTSKKLKALSKLKGKGKKIPLPVILSTTPATPAAQVQPLDATDDNDGQEDFQIDPEFGSVMLGNPNFYYPTTVKNGVIRSKRYKCPKCPSAFDKRDQYAVHLTLHGAQDKYQCDKCDYAVRYTANYVQHQRKHARDAEIRKNYEQAADRAKMIKEQEEAANAQRVRKRPTAEDRKPQRPTKPMLPPAVKLQPQDTIFTNEISDQQTAYELNAAYGATGNLVGETITSLFRCAHCPFECDIRSQLDRHNTHHRVAMNSSGAASKRSWKRSCRFCTYCTHGEVDLAEHTRVHFLRSTGEPVPNNDEYATDETYEAPTPTDVGVGDHVEFHGKRVVYSQRRRKNNTDDQDDVPDDLDEGDIEPFFVFKDCGEVRYDPAIGNDMTTAAIIRSRKRFSPDRPPPKMTTDYNDNRTGDSPKAPPAAFVRFFDGGTRLEFLDDDPVEPISKKRRSKK